jgi:hypothetical protein
MAKKKGNVKQVIRAAGPVISKKEMNKIVKAAGGNVQTAINRIASVQSNMKAADKPAPAVASGAANMLIKQAEKAPAYSTNFGTSKLGQTLQSMLPTPAGPRNPQSGYATYPGQPGFNPGGSPDKNRMIGGTMIRPGGNIAVRPQQIAAAPAVGGGDATIPGGGDTTGDGTTGGNDLDILSYIDDLFSGIQMPEMPEMPDFESMFAQLSSQFDTADPIQLAQLGRAYGADAIRARQRNRRTRSDYRRGMSSPLGMALPALASMAIGGGLTL